MVDYKKIFLNGGIYDTKKYRYMIDTHTGDIKRILICKLDTISAKSSWQIIKKAD